MSLILKFDEYIHDDFWELLDYFGSDFQLTWCSSHDSKAETDRNRTENVYKDYADFNRRTHIFCYQSIGLIQQGTHRPYIAELLKHSADKGPVKVLDVGSGGGQLGLALHTLGFDVSFADLYSESFKFLAWRLRRRQLNRPMYLLDTNSDIPLHDVVICFDVMEHLVIEEQHILIHQCAEWGRNVFMNLIRGDGHDIEGVHHPVDVEGITEYVGRTWNMWWKDYYPTKDGVYRQRLMVYGEGVQENHEDKSN